MSVKAFGWQCVLIRTVFARKLHVNVVLQHIVIVMIKLFKNDPSKDELHVPFNVNPFDHRMVEKVNITGDTKSVHKDVKSSSLFCVLLSSPKERVLLLGPFVCLFVCLFVCT